MNTLAHPSGADRRSAKNADYTRLSAVQNRLGGLDSVATDHADE
jgi:hypothetical protein